MSGRSTLVRRAHTAGVFASWLVLATSVAGAELLGTDDTASVPGPPTERVVENDGGNEDEEEGPQTGAAATGGEQAPEPKGDESDEKQRKKLRVHWEGGLHVDGRWRYFHLKIGGDLQNDTAGYVNTGSAEERLDTAIESGVAWRRARVYAEGRLLRHLEWKLRYDFTAGNPPSLKDASFSLVNLPIPSLELTVGRFKAPLGLDGYTGADDLVLMERSLLSEAFLPSRNTGIMLHGVSSRHRIRWSIAALQPEADDVSFSNTDDLGWSARFAGAFKAGAEKRTLVHLGADFFKRNVGSTIRFASRPESRLAPFFVDTGDLTAAGSKTTVLEAAVQRGPWTLQSELALATVDRAEGDGLFFHGFYVQGSCFLTGETAPYRSDRGTFRRPYPKRSVRDGGLGALELAFRFSRVDLDDGGVRGGTLGNWSAGLNWYATYHTKLMLNAILANLHGTQPVGIFQMRLQVAF